MLRDAGRFGSNLAEPGLGYRLGQDLTEFQGVNRVKVVRKHESRNTNCSELFQTVARRIADDPFQLESSLGDLRVIELPLQRTRYIRPFAERFAVLRSFPEELLANFRPMLANKLRDQGKNIDVPRVGT